MTIPARNQPRSRFGKILAGLGIVLSVLYLLNLTFGVDLLPDALPIIGNIDEATATGILLASLRYLGIDLLRFVPGTNRNERSGDADFE